MAVQLMHYPTPLDYELKLAVVLLTMLTSSIWMRVVVAPLKQGHVRLAFTAPVLLTNIALPTLLWGQERTTCGVTIAILGFTVSWVCSSKALAFAAFKSGPLVMVKRNGSENEWSLLEFTLLYLLPILPKRMHTARNKNYSNSPTATSTNDSRVAALGRWILKLGATVYAIHTVTSDTPPSIHVRDALYVVAVYSMLGVIMDGASALLLLVKKAGVPIRFDLGDSMNEPWASASVAEMWSRRWNLAAGNSLRTTVYDPIVQATRSKMLGSAAAFLMSGIVHELIFYSVMGAWTPNLKWLFFFSIQAPLCWADRLVPGGKGGHVWRVLSMGTLLYLARIAFLAPAHDGGLAPQFAGAMRKIFEPVYAWVPSPPFFYNLNM